jgi:glyoxylase-like metal-dependent hydrolase (beta-lactamase superfamily II)
MPHRFRAIAVHAALLALAVPSLLVAQQEPREVTIEVSQVGGEVYMLTGQGGNIGLSVGKNGAFVIDDQFAPLSDKIKAAIATVTDKPVRFLVNTHWHGDHTGGNAAFGESGAIIVAQENVRKRLASEQFMEALDRTVPATPEAGLPVITFADAVTFHWNDDEVRVFHVAHAHTDGDSIIRFTKANVIHMGDTMFNGFYPFIDFGSGGAIYGVIDATERVLAICDDNTKIIPGHGPVATRADLKEYRDMLVVVRDRIEKLIKEGKSADEVVAAKPTKELDAKWGQSTFTPPDKFVRAVHTGMVRYNKER